MPISCPYFTAHAYIMYMPSLLPRVGLECVKAKCKYTNVKTVCLASHRRGLKENVHSFLVTQEERVWRVFVRVIVGYHWSQSYSPKNLSWRPFVMMDLCYGEPMS